MRVPAEGNGQKTEIAWIIGMNGRWYFDGGRFHRHRYESRMGNPRCNGQFLLRTKAAESTVRVTRAAALPAHAHTHARTHARERYARPIMLHDDHGTPGWLGCAGDLCSLIYVASPASRTCINLHAIARSRSARAFHHAFSRRQMIGDFVPSRLPTSQWRLRTYVCICMYVCVCCVCVRACTCLRLRVNTRAFSWMHIKSSYAPVVSHLC